MIKLKQQRTGPIEIDLTGPDGNAFCLMSHAINICKQLDRNHVPILDEMMAGDYENLVKVFDREFGSFVTLLR